MENKKDTEIIITGKDGGQYAVSAAALRPLNDVAKKQDIARDLSFAPVKQDYARAVKDAVGKPLSKKATTVEVTADKKFHQFIDQDGTRMVTFPVEIQSLIGGSILNPVWPKLGTPLAKTFMIIPAMLEEENNRRKKMGLPLTETLEFSFRKHYRPKMGDTEKEISGGGDLANDHRNTLISAARASIFLAREIEVNGERRMRFETTGFFKIDFSIDDPDKWYATPSPEWRKEGRHFLAIDCKLIADKFSNTPTGAPFFWFGFYVQSKAGKWEGADGKKKRSSIKVLKLLKEKLYITDKNTLARPTECFDSLCRYITYYADKQFFPEISDVVFSVMKGKKKTRTERKSVTLKPERFKNWSYTDFQKEILASIGLTDVRKALVSFTADRGTTALLGDGKGDLVDKKGESIEYKYRDL